MNESDLSAPAQACGANWEIWRLGEWEGLKDKVIATPLCVWCCIYVVKESLKFSYDTLIKAP